MEEQENILSVRFQEFDKEFSRFARHTEWEIKSRNDFEALVCEAGRLAWNGARDGLISSELRDRLRG